MTTWDRVSRQIINTDPFISVHPFSFSPSHFILYRFMKFSVYEKDYRKKFTPGLITHEKARSPVKETRWLTFFEFYSSVICCVCVYLSLLPLSTTGTFQLSATDHVYCSELCNDVTSFTTWKWNCKNRNQEYAQNEMGRGGGGGIKGCEYFCKPLQVRFISFPERFYLEPLPFFYIEVVGIKQKRFL